MNLIKLILSVESPIVDQHNHLINFGDPEIIKSVNKGPAKDDPSLMVNTGDKKIDKLASEFSDIFEGIGQLPGEHRITLKADTTPVIHPPRRVPVETRGKVKQELERMDKHGIIAKVTEPTDWVNSMVVVHKTDGDLSVCLDPTDLNKAIKRPFYPVPTFDDVTRKLSG